MYPVFFCDLSIDFPKANKKNKQTFCFFVLRFKTGNTVIKILTHLQLSLDPKGRDDDREISLLVERFVCFFFFFLPSGELCFQNSKDEERKNEKDMEDEQDMEDDHC